jgi:phage tail-like protein
MIESLPPEGERAAPLEIPAPISASIPASIPVDIPREAPIVIPGEEGVPLPALRYDAPVESTNGEPAAAAVTVGHVVDHYRRYPGELVTLMTRVEVHEPLAGFSVSVHVPAGLEVDYYRAVDRELLPVMRPVRERPLQELMMLPGADGEPFPIAIPGQPERLLAPARMGQELIWQVAETQEAGARHEFEVTALVLPAYEDVILRSEAVVHAAGGGEQRMAAEAVEIAIAVQGRYLEHLPALYEQDSFMARFVMLFESFWRPISQQIDVIADYFDPRLTPARFLPWLASWFDLILDETWAEDQQRELVDNIIWFYRKRGTRVALQRYLEIYTRGQVEIVERRAKNLRLGAGGRLGVGVALGTGNVPHTFEVHVKLPPMQPVSPAGAAAEAEAARLEKQRRRMVERIIDMEKPAHTTYRLEFS